MIFSYLLKYEGTLKLIDDRIYIGKFDHEGKINEGILHYPNGDIFEGKFLDFQPAHGSLKLAKTGQQFNGMFSDGVPNEGQWNKTFPSH